MVPLLNRREVLRVAAGGLGAVCSPGIVAPAMTSRGPVTARKRRTVFVDDFYSNSDQGDWVHAFERAQEVADEVLLRDKNYEINRSIICSPHTHIAGVGSGARITNLRSADYHPILHSAFLIGNMHPAAIDYAQQGRGEKLPCCDVFNAQKGDVRIRVNSATEIEKVSVGSSVLIRTRQEFPFADQYALPAYGQFNIVAGINRDQIILAFPLYEDLHDGCLSLIGGTQDPFMSQVLKRRIVWHMVRGVGISNLSIDAAHVVNTRTGMFECSFSKLQVVKCLSPFAVNAAVRCQFVDINASSCTARAIEIKCLSDHSLFKRYAASIVGDDFQQIVDIGERSSFNALRGIKITVNPFQKTSSAIYAENGKNNTLSGFDIDALDVADDYTPIALRGSSNGPTYGSVIQDGIIRTGSRSARHLQIGSSINDAFAVSDYKVERVNFLGSSRRSESVRIATIGHGQVSDCWFPYQITISSGASAPVATRNTVTSG